MDSAVILPGQLVKNGKPILPADLPGAFNPVFFLKLLKRSANGRGVHKIPQLAVVETDFTIVMADELVLEMDIEDLRGTTQARSPSGIFKHFSR
jgi:hypothetical protein